MPEPTKQRDGDQVLPEPGKQAVQQHILDNIDGIFRESLRVGLERYGRPLETFNGRSTITDIHDEVRDLFAYLTQAKLQAQANRDTLVNVVSGALLEGSLLWDDGGNSSDGSDLAVSVAEAAVDAIMGWVVGVMLMPSQVSNNSQ